MKESDATKVLMLVKLNWKNQPAETLVKNFWARVLADVPFEAAQQAAEQFIRDAGPEPPTAGAIHKLALDIDFRRRQGLKRLQEPMMPEDQRQRNIRFLRDITAAIGNRAEVVRVYPDFKGIPTQAAEAEIFAPNPSSSSRRMGGEILHHCERCAKPTSGWRINVYTFVCAACQTANRISELRR
jgi:hypothetical protein